MAFEAQIDEHKMIIDTKAPLGNNTGPSPKKLLLTSLAGCTAMDVVSLLEKMRVSFTDFVVEVEGDLTAEHPIAYSDLRIIYRITGNSIDKSKVEKAVKLSKEKYCGVSAMLSKSAPISHSIEYIEG